MKGQVAKYSSVSSDNNSQIGVKADYAEYYEKMLGNDKVQNAKETLIEKLDNDQQQEGAFTNQTFSFIEKFKNREHQREFKGAFTNSASLDN